MGTAGYDRRPQATQVSKQKWAVALEKEKKKGKLWKREAMKTRRLIARKWE